MHALKVMVHLQQLVQHGHEQGQFDPVIGSCNHISNTTTTTNWFTAAHSDSAMSSLTTTNYSTCTCLIHTPLLLSNDANSSPQQYDVTLQSFSTTANTISDKFLHHYPLSPWGRQVSSGIPIFCGQCMDPSVLCLQHRHPQYHPLRSV